MDQTQGESRSPLLWLNLVCLDAPLVALSWQALFARGMQVELRLAERAALFLTAWLIYLSDRLVDTVSLPPNGDRSPRQRFCFSHRRLWMAALAIVGATDAFVILSSIDRVTVRAGLFVGAAAVLYLAINSATKAWRVLPLKEVSVGTLFALGVVLVPLVRTSQHDLPLAIVCIAFAVVCTMNCVSIAIWESEIDTAQEKPSIATRWPAIEAHLCAVLMLVGGVLALLAFFLPRLRVVVACLASSLFLLAAIAWPHSRLPTAARTALADLVLLTPLVPLLAGFAR